MDINISIPWKDGDGTISIQGDYSTITITSLDRNSPTGKQRLIFTTVSGREDEDFTILDVWYTNNTLEVTGNFQVNRFSEDGTIRLSEDETLRLVENEIL